jgi:thiol-disulfide isomerase/thioredoxin
MALIAPLLVLALTPASAFAQANTPAPSKQQSPEQYLRALFYREDRNVMERDGEAIVSKKDASLESRAWFVSLARFGKTPLTALKLVDGMRKEAPDSPWTLTVRSFFASDLEQAITMSEKAIAKDSRDDILFLCTRGIVGQPMSMNASEQEKQAHAEQLKKFLERHRPQFEGTAQGLATEAELLARIDFLTQGKEHSDEAAALYDRALKLEPRNEVALSGKLKDLISRKQYKEADDLYEKFPAPIESQDLHMTYWYDILANMPELGDEELAKRYEADGRALFDHQEPTEQVVQDLLMMLWRHSAARADALTDLIEKRYPSSKLSESAMLTRAWAKVDGEFFDFEKFPADTRSEIADRMLEFLKRPGRTNESTDQEAAFVLSGLMHYMEISSDRLFEAARLARPENRLDLINVLADRKAHLPELEAMASEQIEALIRELGASSTVWHYDDRYAEMTLESSWATLADWEDVLGWIYIQQGKVKEAEPKLLTAEKLLDAQSYGYDDHIDLLLHVGRLNVAKGNYAKAEEYLGRAMSVEYFFPDEHPAIAAYKELYLRQHGNAEGLDKYLAAAYETDRSRRKKLILKERIAQPKPIPAFKLTTIEGKTISSEELKGKVAVINFWGTWCGPCKFELPEVQKFYEKYKDNPNVVFLTVDAKDSVEQVKKFMTEKKYTFPVMMEGDYLDQATVNGFPTTWFIDRSGNKVFEKNSSSRRVVEEFTWRVEALLESQASSTGAPKTP